MADLKIETNYIPLGLDVIPEKEGMAIGDTPAVNSTPVSIEGNIGGVMAGGVLQSSNYVAGISGWKIDANGDIDFKSGDFAGKRIVTISTGYDIQKAINSINDAGGGIIYFLPGTYTLSGNLTLYTNIILEGVSVKDCILDFNSQDYSIDIFGATADQNNDMGFGGLVNLTVKNATAQNVHIRDVKNLIINGCIFKDTSVNHILADRVKQTKIINCHFENTTRAGSYGIRFENVQAILSINGCYFENLQYAIHGVDGIVTDCEIYNCDFGVYDPLNWLTIDGNLINYCDDHAIYGRNCSLIISNNRLFINGTVATTGQIYIYNNGSIGSVISGNYFKNTNGYNILLSSAYEVSITGNTHRPASNDREFIKMVYADHNVITGNVTKGTANYDGILLQNSNNNVISGNKITDYAQYGISIESGCDRNIVLGNNLNPNTVGAIENNGTNTEIGYNIE